MLGAHNTKEHHAMQKLQFAHHNFPVSRSKMFTKYTHTWTFAHKHPHTSYAHIQLHTHTSIILSPKKQNNNKQTKQTYKTARGKLLTALKKSMNRPGPRSPTDVISRLTDNTVHL